jgi:protoporphyrinogen oxidase
MLVGARHLGSRSSGRLDTDPRGQRWGIVGGGVLGMTLAHRLAADGHDVTLMEAADHLGGLASAWTLGDIVWDRHYHVVLASDRCLRALLAELGLEHELRWTRTGTGFYVDGRLSSLSNTAEFLRFPALGLSDKLRLALTILYAARIRSGRRLEAVPVADWLTRWSGLRTFERIWLPLLRAKLGESYRQVSAAFIWATIARLYAARRNGLKTEQFGYVPGGYARILSRFAEVLAAEHVQTRLGFATRRVRRGPGGHITVQAEDGSFESFDRVILTVPAPVAAAVCPELSPEERRRLQGVRYQGLICASLLLESPLSPFYVTNIADPRLPFTAVVEMSALVAREQFGGHALVYLPKYVDPEDPAFARSDAEIQAEFYAGLRRMHARFDPRKVLAFRVSRVRRVFALPTLNYSRDLPAVTTSVPGLFVVNSAQIVNGTLNVNETVRLAAAALAGPLAAPARRPGV